MNELPPPPPGFEIEGPAAGATAAPPPPPPGFEIEPPASNALDVPHQAAPPPAVAAPPRAPLGPTFQQQGYDLGAPPEPGVARAPAAPIGPTFEQQGYGGIGSAPPPTVAAPPPPAPAGPLPYVGPSPHDLLTMPSDPDDPYGLQRPPLQQPVDEESPADRLARYRNGGAAPDPAVQAANFSRQHAHDQGVREQLGTPEDGLGYGWSGFGRELQAGGAHVVGELAKTAAFAGRVGAALSGAPGAVDRPAEQVRQVAASLEDRHPMHSKEMQFTAGLLGSAPQIAATVAMPELALPLWGLTGAASSYNRAKEKGAPEHVALGEAVMGALVGTVTSLIPGAFAGKGGVPFLRGTIQSMLAMGVQSAADDVTAKVGHGDPKLWGDVLQDAITAAGVGALLHVVMSGPAEYGRLKEPDGAMLRRMGLNDRDPDLLNVVAKMRQGAEAVLRGHADPSVAARVVDASLTPDEQLAMERLVRRTAGDPRTGAFTVERKDVSSHGEDAQQQPPAEAEQHAAEPPAAAQGGEAGAGPVEAGGDVPADPLDAERRPRGGRGGGGAGEPSVDVVDAGAAHEEEGVRPGQELLRQQFGRHGIELADAGEGRLTATLPDGSTATVHTGQRDLGRLFDTPLRKRDFVASVLEHDETRQQAERALGKKLPSHPGELQKGDFQRILRTFEPHAVTTEDGDIHLHAGVEPHGVEEEIQHLAWNRATTAEEQGAIHELLGRGSDLGDGAVVERASRAMRDMPDQPAAGEGPAHEVLRRIRNGEQFRHHAARGQSIDVPNTDTSAKSPSKAPQAPAESPAGARGNGKLKLPTTAAEDQELADGLTGTLPGERPGGFTTAQGSTYTWDGTSSTRNKSPHQGHDPKDVGPKPPSQRTVFVDPEHAREIGMHLTMNRESKARVELSGGKRPVVILTSQSGRNPRTGETYVNTNSKSLPTRTEPAVGLSPVEFFADGKVHPGSPITELHGPAESPRQDVKDNLTPPAPAAADSPVDKPLQDGNNKAVTNVPAAPDAPTKPPAPRAQEADHGHTERSGDTAIESTDGGRPPAVEPAGPDAGGGVPTAVSGGGRPDVEPGHDGVGGGGDAGRESLDAGGTDLEQADGGAPGPVEGTGEGAGRGPGRSDGGDSASPALVKGDDHRIEPGDELAPKGDAAKLRANVRAIKLLRELEEAKRPATPEERKVLAQYTGWGWAGERFNPEKPNHAADYKTIKDLLTDVEWRSARTSTLNAHYTSPDVIRPMWDLVRRLGFEGGRVLEPGMGIGHFFGMMPKDLKAKSKLVGVELDNVSARISKQLYPHADITAGGFETARIPPNSIDVAISNVPFGKYTVPGARDYPKDVIHDYFFKRALDMVKPGGIVAFITSDGTLDKADPAARRWLAERADLVGVVRLPNDAFKGNAGTDVTTDIVVLRKKDGSAFEGAGTFEGRATVGEGSYEDKDGNKLTGPIRVNEYFARHPENALGEHTLSGTQYGRGDYALVSRPGQDTGRLLAEAVGRFPEGAYGKAPPADVSKAAGSYAGEKDKELAYVTKDGQTYQVRDGKLARPEWLDVKGTGKDPEAPVTPQEAAARVEVARDWVNLKRDTVELFNAENDPKATDAQLRKLRAKLNQAYDAYVKKHGTLTKRFAHTEKARFLVDDPEYPLLQSMEEPRVSIDPKTGKEKYEFPKGPIFSKRLREPRVMPDHADTAQDAMNISLGYQNAVDPDLVAKLLGVDEPEARRQILASGDAFEHPGTGRIETKAQYLSGNVREKLRAAKAAAELDAKYKPNVDALEAVQPPWMPLARITFQLSGHWLPSPVLEQFVKDVFKTTRAAVRYVPGLNGYSIAVPDADRHNPAIQTTFGTAHEDPRRKLDAIELLQHALNGTEPTVTMTVGSGREATTVRDDAATAAARDKTAEIKREFVSWVKSSPAEVDLGDGDGTRSVGKAVEHAFNMVNNSVVPPEYDGSHLVLPGLAFFKPKPHQKGGAARFLSEGSGMMAWGVGAGKTLGQIITAMEHRRLVLARKPVIVVQKATVGQFAATYRRAYPDARVLVANERTFAQKNRRRFMAQATMGDWDSIVMTQPQFDRIQSDPQTVVDYIRDQIDQYEEMIRAEQQQQGKQAPTVKQLERAKKGLEAKLTKALDGLKTRADNVVYFEQMGVDLLMIDEAHAYKKIPIVTRKQNVKGIPADSSDRALGLILKAAHVQAKRGGRGVILATGTPITNSMAEAYVMLKLASPHVLREFNIDNFDDFANTFGEAVEKMEFGWGGKFKMVTRFNRFVNKQALVSMIRQSFDVRMGNKKLGLKVPDVRGGKPRLVMAPQNAAQKQVSDWIMAIAERFESLTPKERKENSWVPIVTMQAGMAAALDPRLVDPRMPDLPDSKVNIAVREIADLYHRTTAASTVMVKDPETGRMVPETTDRGVQLVFADRFAPMNTSKLDAFLGGKAADIEIEDPDAPAPTAIDRAAAEEDDDEGEDKGEQSELSKLEDEEYKRGGFNVYHDLRDKLVAAGVPKDEIAIIHDYNTDKRREKLFERVNAGGIRVLIGSTEKMGVGVNVQTRNVALHQLDPPRMMTPAMMEQRVGRGVRQGNENRAIDLVNYGTEKSLDTGIYQILEDKSKMYADVLQGTGGGDEFEDPADEVTLSMAEMKSRLTGDDRVMRREELTQKVRNLERQKAGFDNGQYARVDELDTQRKLARNYRDKFIPQHEAMEQSLGKAFGADVDRWDVTLGDVKLKGAERKDVAAALDEFMAKLEAAKMADPNKSVERYGTINGFDVQVVGFASHTAGKDGEQGWDGARMYLREKDGSLVGQSDVRSGGGILTSLQAKARGAPKVTQEARDKLKQIEANIPALEAAVGRTFEFSDELEKVRTELAGINAELLAEGGKAGAPGGKAAMKVKFRNTRRGGFVALPDGAGVRDFAGHLYDSARRLAGRLFPTLQRATPRGAEILSRQISARAYAREASPWHNEQIITGGRPMPLYERKELSKLVGAVLTQDNLDGVRATAKDPSKVFTLIGAPGSPFPDDAAYDTACTDPRVVDAIDRWKLWWKGEAEANYRASQDVDPTVTLPTRGPRFGARINLKAIDPANPTPPKAPVGGGGKGNLRNPRKFTSPFARQAKGTGQAYETDLGELIANTLERGTAPAELARFYKQLVADGVAVIPGPKAKPPTEIGGKPVFAWDMKARTIVLVPADPADPTRAFAQNKVIYIRKDLEGEIRRAVNVDNPLVNSRVIRAAAAVANRVALAGIAEGMFHVGNQFAALAGSPGTGFVLPGMFAKGIKLLNGDAGVRRQLVELARIGALADKEPGNLKNPLKWVGEMIRFTDRVGRLVLDDAFTELARRGLVKDTPGNRANWANKFGQYNKQAQHWAVWFARETGLGPFATAGTTFYTQSVNNLLLNPGVEATSATAAAKLKGLMLLRFIAPLAAAALWNLLRWGRVDPDGVPIGAVKLGVTKGGRILSFDPMELIGIRRGLRATGIGPAVETLRKGGSKAEALDDAVGSAARSAASPFEGPIIRFMKTLFTGSDVAGRRVADRAEKGGSQFVQQAKAAAKHASPTIEAFTDEHGMARQFGRFAPTVGARDESSAMALARRLARQQTGAGNDMRPSELAKYKLRQGLIDGIRQDADKGWAAAGQALDDGRITPREYKDLKAPSARSELAERVEELQDPNDALRVFKAASKAEREELEPLMYGKLKRANVTPEQRERLYQQLDAMAAPR